MGVGPLDERAQAGPVHDVGGRHLRENGWGGAREDGRHRDARDTENEEGSRCDHGDRLLSHATEPRKPPSAARRSAEARASPGRKSLSPWPGPPTSVERTGRCGMTTVTGRHGQECCQPCNPRPDKPLKLFRSPRGWSVSSAAQSRKLDRNPCGPCCRRAGCRGRPGANETGLGTHGHGRSVPYASETDTS